MKYSGFNGILSEAIISSMDKYLDENRIVNEATIVNNMSKAEELIAAQWTNPDDVFHIAINQREKDNGGRHTHPSTWYRNGGSHAGCNYIAYSIVSGTSKNDIINNFRTCKLTLCPPYDSEFNTSSVGLTGIKEICQKYNARAYMTINKRSMNTSEHFAQIDQQRASQISGKPMGQPEDRNNVGPFMLKALGKIIHNISVNRQWGLIDCDTTDPQAIVELRDLLQRNNINVFHETPSHNGVHFWVTNRDALKLNQYVSHIGSQPESFPDFEKYRTGGMRRRAGDPMVQCHTDTPILLYSDSSKFTEE